MHNKVPSLLKSMAVIGIETGSVVLTHENVPFFLSQLKYLTVLSAEQLANMQSSGLNVHRRIGAVCSEYVANTF